MPFNEQRAVANVRERKRTQKLNHAYKQLQSIIPKEPSDKMSKIHTLKLALAYIDFLNNLLKEDDGNSEIGSSGQPTPESSSSFGCHHQLRSPCAGSPPSASYAHTSATSCDDYDEYARPCKRMRVESDQGIAQAHGLHGSVGPTGSHKVNHNHFSEVASNHSQSPSSYDGHSYYELGSISSPECCPPSHSQAHDEMSIQLRHAFREYRTTKRKDFRL